MMHHLFYFPVALPFLAFLILLLLGVFILIQIHVLRFAYLSIGLGPRTAMMVLVASLLGSYINIPVAVLPEQRLLTGQEIEFFGMHYVVPVVVDWPGTVIAVNVGGALIPTALSLYLLWYHRIWGLGALATAIVAAVVHILARPVPGIGIAVPIIVPPLLTAIVALVLSSRRAGPLAYISGSLGTLIGADLLNLGKVQGLGAPIASIGGAGTFDSIFLTGVLAVLLASFRTT
jgi:uncharacterized membrane protein